ncbi:hypothetical protein BIFADO_00035, partial [Bifidobacterium adolescentis L2-32]
GRQADPRHRPVVRDRLALQAADASGGSLRRREAVGRGNRRRQGRRGGDGHEQHLLPRHPPDPERRVRPAARRPAYEHHGQPGHRQDDLRTGLAGGVGDQRLRRLHGLAREGAAQARDQRAGRAERAQDRRGGARGGGGARAGLSEPAVKVGWC